MIIPARPDEDILDSGMKHICFAINSEGVDCSDFASYIQSHYWPELANVGQSKLGTSVTHERDGVFYHALVCYSVVDGWKNTAAVVRRCFDSIETDDPVASIGIGTDVLDCLHGSQFYAVCEGMEDSKKTIVLYS